MRIPVMHNTSLQIRLTLILALLVGAAGSSRGGTSVAVSFSGRGVNNDPNSGAFMATAETAGVVPRAHWNNVDITGNSPANSSKTLGLFDSGYNFTGVKLIYDASDSWSDGGGVGTSDEKMMKGIIKANPNSCTPTSGTNVNLVFTNVPSGNYNVIVYLMENDVNCNAISGSSGTNCAEGSVTVGATSYYVEEEQIFNSYILATSTTPGAYAEANYAQFNSVSPAGDGTIKITVTKNTVCGGANKLTDGYGVAGVQLIQNSGSAYPPNTDTCAITSDPQSTLAIEGANASFSVGSSGPCKFQWTTNGVALAGATNSTLLYTARLVDNNLQFRALVYNNVKTNTSAVATLTVDPNTPPTLTQGFLQVQQFQNIGPNVGSGGLADLKTNLDGDGNPLTTPTLTYYVGGANVPQTSPDVDNC